MTDTESALFSYAVLTVSFLASLGSAGAAGYASSSLPMGVISSVAVVVAWGVFALSRYSMYEENEKTKL
jgi:hypothetical protein